MKKLYIFYPSKITGGAEYLLKRTAEILQHDYRITIIDFADGWIKNNISLSPESFDSITYREGEKIETFNDAIIITAAIYLRNIDVYFKPSQCKILLWAMQPYNVIPFFPVLKNMQRESKKLYTFLKNTGLKSEFTLFNRIISLAARENSLYAMDKECDEILNEYFNLRYSGYLPVAITKQSFDQNKLVFNFTTDIHIAWLGRLDLEFKYFILKKVMEDIERYSEKAERKITFSIIGDGPGKKSLQSIASKMKHVSFSFLGELRGECLTSALKKCQLIFAMGTSAIESSARKIPTILLDFSYSTVSDAYRYRWFHESNGYVLGRDVSRFFEKSCGNRLTISDLFNELEQDGIHLAEKCFAHALEFHSEESLKLALLDALKKSKLDIADLYNSGITNKPFWYFIKPLINKAKTFLTN